MTKRKSPAGGGASVWGAGVGMEIAAKEKARRGQGEVQGGSARGGVQGEAAAGPPREARAGGRSPPKPSGGRFGLRPSGPGYRKNFLCSDSRSGRQQPMTMSISPSRMPAASG